MRTTMSVSGVAVSMVQVSQITGLYLTAVQESLMVGNTWQMHLCVQVLNEEGTMVFERVFNPLQGPMVIEQIPYGDYRVIVYHDHDGSWCGGHVLNLKVEEGDATQSLLDAIREILPPVTPGMDLGDELPPTVNPEEAHDGTNLS